MVCLFVGERKKKTFLLLHKRVSLCQWRLKEAGFYVVEEQLQVQLVGLLKWQLITDWHPCVWQRRARKLKEKVLRKFSFSWHVLKVGCFSH